MNIIDILISKLSKGNTKNIQHFDNAMTVLTTRLTQVFNRINKTKIIESQGIRLIRYLLFNIPDMYFFTQKDTNDAELYVKIFSGMRDGLKPAYDFLDTNTDYLKLFTTNKTGVTSEIITTTVTDSPLMTLPVFQSYPQWKNVNTLNMLHCESLTLPITFIDNKINFTPDTPELIIYGLDIPTLFLKYKKYIDSIQVSNEDDLKKLIFDNDVYSEYVKNQIIENLMIQSYNTWMLTCVNKLLELQDDIAINMIMDYQQDKLIVANVFKQAFNDLLKQVILLKRNNISIEDFYSLQIFWNNKNMFDILRHRKQNEIPQWTQYKAIDFLSHSLILENILRCLKIMKNTSKYTGLQRKIDVYFNNILRSNTVSHIHNNKVKSIFSYKLDDLQELL